MSNFFDVTPEKWFYNDVVEMESILDSHDVPLISGIPFNSFVPGYEAFDEIITISAPSSVIVVNADLTHTADTPVRLYVDGINTLIDSVTKNSPVMGQSAIKLRRTVNPNSSIRVVQIGIPAVNPSNRNLPMGVTKPFSFPYIQLPVDSGYSYVFNPFSNAGFERAVCNTSQLKHIMHVTGAMSSNYNFFRGDYEYTISPNGLLYVPFSLDNQRINVSYILRNNTTGIEVSRGFSAYAQRPILSGSTRYDKVYFGFFPDALTSRAEFFTFLNSLRKNLWSKFSEGDPFTSTKTTSRFGDVSSALGSNPWWWASIRDLEELVMPDGSYFLMGMTDGNLHVDSVVTRAEIVTTMDKFRIWFIEAFK